MSLKPKHKRLMWFGGMCLCVALGMGMLLTIFRDNLVFFYSPSDLRVKPVDAERVIRIGGLVEQGSVKTEDDGMKTEFVVADMAERVVVRFKGILPDLFREGQGVVAEGHWRSGVFEATQILAKHDENYMPPEVADAIKRTGHWKGGEQ